VSTCYKLSLRNHNTKVLTPSARVHAGLHAHERDTHCPHARALILAQILEQHTQFHMRTHIHKHPHTCKHTHSHTDTYLQITTTGSVNPPTLDAYPSSSSNLNFPPAPFSPNHPHSPSLHRIESQRPGPALVTASLASAAESAVRHSGRGGDCGDAPVGGSTVTSSDNSVNSTGGGGGLRGGILSSIVGGGNGVGGALFPTPQGALRNALAQQRDGAKQVGGWRGYSCALYCTLVSCLVLCACHAVV
jgi:hypothetical protein